MIISITDSENNLKDAGAFAALIGGMTALTKSKPTLIMQLTGFTDESALNIMYGKVIEANTIKDVLGTYSNDGIDGLILEADTGNLAQEHYDECVTPILEKKNMLDILKPTSVPRLLDIIDTDIVSRMITGSKSLSTSEGYSYVYIVMPNNDPQLYEEVTKYTDEELILVPQIRKLDAELPNDKSHFVVKDFEPESKFNLSYLKKMLNVSKIYYVPHNVNFNDAVLDRNVIDFLLRNREAIKNDVNYEFTNSIYNLISRYVSNREDDKEDDEEFEKMKNEYEKDVVKLEDMDIIPEDSVQEVTVKKSFWRKEKKLMVDMHNTKKNKSINADEM